VAEAAGGDEGFAAALNGCGVGAIVGLGWSQV